MITECKLHVVVHLEPVRHVDLEPRAPAALCNAPSQRNIVEGIVIVHTGVGAPGGGQAGALGDDHLVAPLVDHGAAHLALVTLLAHAPDEVLAVGAEGGLLEEHRDELVPVDLVHAPPERHAPLGSPPLLLLEGPGGLVLLVLGGPLQLDLDVQLPLQQPGVNILLVTGAAAGPHLGLQLEPYLVQGLARSLNQLRQGQLAVGDKVVGRHRGVVEHSEANLDITLCTEAGHSFYFQHNTDSKSPDSH